jgi:pilus assembly protein CpaE
MTSIVIAAAEQSIAYDLRAALSEMEPVEALFVVESTSDLVSTVLRLDPDVVLVHDGLGPEPALQAVRDLSLRRPTCASLVVSLAPTAAALAAAMDAGARGMVAYPLTFEDLQARVVVAGDWARQMRRLIATSATGRPGGGADGARGKVVAFTGSKGGVGTTTIATHVALDVVRGTANAGQNGHAQPGRRVCLLDLDLEKGDVTGLLELRHRASIADVAKVSEDFSARAVSDAVVVHESGLHLLLTPADVREVEAVSPRALREVLSVLRQEYDLVVVDAGSHVTPAQAAVVELADEVVMVTTPDVLAVRGLRRAITTWEGLDVRKENDVRVLVNRMSRHTTVSVDTVRQLTRAPVLDVVLPAIFRRLEPALNARDPLLVREDAWWRGIRAVGQEVGAGSAGRAAGRAAGRRRGRNRGAVGADAGREPRDRGAVTVETVGLLPVIVLVAVLVWQAALYGVTFTWSGNASAAAARAAAMGQDATAAARAAVPAGLADDVSVSAGRDSVRVSVKVPLIAPGLASLPGDVTVERAVVPEP